MQLIGMRNQQLNKINQLVSWERYKEALGEAEEWVRQDPEDADALGALAFVYQFLDTNKALHWSGEAIRRDPESELAWRIRLVIAYERKDWRSFKELIPEMLRMFPEEAYIYRLHSQYMLTQNKFSEALTELEQALALQHSALNHAVYAYALALSGNFEGSRQAERTALRENPEDLQVLLYTGWAADHRNDHEQASERMSAAVRLDPDNAQIREEYLTMLQKSYWFYRVLLLPTFLKKLKPWQLLLTWMACWLLFRPLLIVLIIL